MKMLISIFVMICVSCGTFRSKLKETDKRIDPEFRSYVINFQEDFEKYVEIPVSFGEENPMVAGSCRLMYDGFREIKINKDSWKTLTEDQKEQLIFHELGHCVLGMGHLEGRYESTSCPLSVMDPVVFSSYQGIACFRKYKQYYLGQMKLIVGI